MTLRNWAIVGIVEAAEGLRNIVGYGLTPLLDVVFRSPVAVAEEAVGYTVEIVHHRHPHTAVAFFQQVGIMSH